MFFVSSAFALCTSCRSGQVIVIVTCYTTCIREVRKLLNTREVNSIKPYYKTTKEKPKSGIKTLVHNSTISNYCVSSMLQYASIDYAIHYKHPSVNISITTITIMNTLIIA